jgi:hypothetical protein
VVSERPKTKTRAGLPKAWQQIEQHAKALATNKMTSQDAFHRQLFTP